ncbi:chromosome 6 orf 201, partial [Chelydra serpentina]
EEGECFHSVSFENILTGKGLHREVYLSPEPDHVPRWKRNISNRLAEKYKQFRLNLKDTPMSAVIVRWIKRNMLASYDYHSVIQELSRFGAIESVTPSGRQTAIVIFKDIISACKAMNAFPANNPSRRIQCVWHHKFMSEYKMSGHRKVKLTSY